MCTYLMVAVSPLLNGSNDDLLLIAFRSATTRVPSAIETEAMRGVCSPAPPCSRALPGCSQSGQSIAVVALVQQCHGEVSKTAYTNAFSGCTAITSVQVFIWV
jgi:hypothetical protein